MILILYNKSPDSFIHESKLCKVTRMNHILEVVSLQRVPDVSQFITRLSKEEYMLNETGEVLEYKQSEHRGQNIAGLKRTFKKIRRLINTNFCGAPNELFLTLTYAENMTDRERLYRDFDRFMKQLRYHYGSMGYIAVIEPQGRGAWHLHVLLRLNGKDAAFLPHKELTAMWGHGFVWIRRLKVVDNIGAYLCAYLADLEVPDDALIVPGDVVTKEVVDKDGHKQTKRFIKGGRCHMYPPGMNIYRHSRDMLQPETIEMTYAEIKEIVGDCAPDYGCSVTISDDNGKQLNKVTYQNFNLKRTKRQGENDGDSSTGVRGVSCGTANPGQFAQDTDLLSKRYESLSPLSGTEPRSFGDEFNLAAGICPAPSNRGSEHSDPAKLCSGASGLSDMVLFGGHAFGESFGEIQVAQSPTEGDRHSDR